MKCRYCSEDVEKIEGFIPVDSRQVKMVIHHRLESHDESGKLRSRFLTVKQLKLAGLYYNRPAAELIWMTDSEHKKLHQQDLTYQENLQSMSLSNVNRICKETTKQKLRAKATGRKHSETTKRKISEYNKGKKLSENVKQKISKTLKGKCTNWSVKSKVLCIETQEVFDSANACAAYFHLDAGLLGRRLDTGLAEFPKKLPNLSFKRV